jgi:hypothetical protein
MGYRVKISDYEALPDANRARRLFTSVRTEDDRVGLV